MRPLSPHKGSVYDVILYKIRRQVRAVWPVLKRFVATASFLCVQILVFVTPLREQFEFFALEHFHSLRGARPAPAQVTMVCVDAKTFQKLSLPLDGPIPRRYFAQAVNYIAAAGAKMIFLDYLFLAESQDKVDDTQLARAFADSPSVIGWSVTARTNTDQYGVRKDELSTQQSIAAFVQSAKVVVPLEVQRGPGGTVDGIALPEEIMGRPDERVPLLKPLRRFVSPSLRAPGNDDFINFYGGPFSLTNISLAELLDPAHKPPADYFRDRVVVIGPATHAVPGITGKDSFPTPASDLEIYGVEIHGTIAANLLDGTWIRRAPLRLDLLLSNILVVVCVYGLMAAAPVRALAITLCGALAFSAAAYSCFSRGLYFPPGSLLFVIVLPLFALVRCVFSAVLSRGGRSEVGEDEGD